MNKKTKQNSKIDSDDASTGKERLDLWDKAINGNDTKALMKLSRMNGMITSEQYEDYLQIKKEFG